MFQYRAMEVEDLRLIAGGMAPRMAGLSVEEGALAPRQVAERVLSELERGTLPEWCVPYLVIDPQSCKVVAGCNFKGTPADGVVEIGYGVSPLQRGKGIATAAVAFLVDVAKHVPGLNLVVANISPKNLASQRVVAKLGFCMGESFVDTDGEELVVWALRIAI